MFHIQVSKLQGMEEKQKPLHEKARKFLEKNVEQTALNRDLKNKIKVLDENNNKLVLLLAAFVARLCQKGVNRLNK